MRFHCRFLRFALLALLPCVVCPAEEGLSVTLLPVLLPVPRLLIPGPGAFESSKGGGLVLPAEVPEGLSRAGQRLAGLLAKPETNWRVVNGGTGPVSLQVDPAACAHAQGYVLDISPEGISIVGGDDAGLYYGIHTACQWVMQAKDAIPCVHIEDWPDFPKRGVMLDISRDKIPTIETMYALVDRLSGWKINEIQLYTEHTFAYAGHETVWKDFSPMTGEEIEALDAYCRDRFIELVPNQNSMAHLGGWLRHDEYKDLAEDPTHPVMLNPVDPRSIEFLAGLYDDLLPHFISKQFNVGCDEASLGRNRSKEACEKLGEGRVYMDYLLKVHSLVQARGKRMQFWADIIFNHSDLIPELPEDVVPMIWGYEADHPYEKQCGRIAATNLSYYVCPGTSTWNTLLGRTDNMTANMRNAAQNGKAHGATGLLVTDWGDNGHWQYLPVSYAGYAYAAALSWAVDANLDLDLAHALDVHVFFDAAGRMGQLALDLGNVYQRAGRLLPNASMLVEFLYRPDTPLEDWPLKGLKPEALHDAMDEIQRLTGQLDSTQMACDDAQLIVDEFKNNAAMALHGCTLPLARLETQADNVQALPKSIREILAPEIDSIIQEHRRLWLERNRPGGLTQSLEKFEKLLAEYHTE